VLCGALWWQVGCLNLSILQHLLQSPGAWSLGVQAVGLDTGVQQLVAELVQLLPQPTVVI
jgi:hypothetical protein